MLFDLEQHEIGLKGWGYSLTFNTRGSVPIFGVRNLPLNQYLGFMNNYIGENSIFGVHKCEELVRVIAVTHSINVLLYRVPTNR